MRDPLTQWFKKFGPVLLCAGLSAVTGGWAMAATFPQDYSKILLPVLIPTPVIGASDAEWLTHVSITITGTQSVSLIGWYPFCQIECETPPVPPNITFYPFFNLSSTELAGSFLWVEHGREKDVHVALRVEDVAIESEIWGTDVPVVPEASFITTVAVIEDIPLSPGFRSNLRVYDLDPVASHSAHIKLYSVDPMLVVPTNTHPPEDRLLFDRTILLSPVLDLLPRPGLVYLDLSDLPELVGAQVVRAEITPAEGEAFPFWVLASTTNNTTQQITTFSPR